MKNIKTPVEAVYHSDGGITIMDADCYDVLEVLYGDAEALADEINKGYFDEHHTLYPSVRWLE